jgi:hypothetical protein
MARSHLKIVPSTSASLCSNPAPAAGAPVPYPSEEEEQSDDAKNMSTVHQNAPARTVASIRPRPALVVPSSLLSSSIASSASAGRSANSGSIVLRGKSVAAADDALDIRPRPALEVPSSLLSSTIKSSGGSGRNNSSDAAAAADDALDRIDLLDFAANIVPQESTSDAAYTDAENGTIVNAIEVNVKRLKDPRWEARPCHHFACKQFTLIENGESIATARAEGILHCSAALALANFWMVCTRRAMKRHLKKHGADLPREIYRTVNDHHYYYHVDKVCHLSISHSLRHSQFLVSFSFPQPLLFCYLSHTHIFSLPSCIYFFLSFSAHATTF